MSVSGEKMTGMSDLTTVIAEVLETITDECVNRYDEQAEMIVAAVREANTIRTESELAACELGTVVRSEQGGIWERLGDGDGWYETASGCWHPMSDLSLPCTILFRP